MSISHNDIFNTALELHASASTSANAESSLRSAVSRAYYAALHASLDALPQQFSPTVEQLKGKDSHILVQTAMMQWAHSLTPGRSEAQEIVRHLPKLKKMRKNADYAIASAFSLHEVQDVIERTRSVLEKTRHAKSKQAK